MKLIELDASNLEHAVKTAKKIFPNEDLRSVYEDSIKANDPEFKYYLGVTDHGQTVGITGHYEESDEIWLGWFGILPECQRKRFGVKMLNETYFKAIRSEDLPILRIWCDIDNVAAQEFYVRCGCVRDKVGELVAGKTVQYLSFQPSVVSVLMETGRC